MARLMSEADPILRIADPDRVTLPVRFHGDGAKDRVRVPTRLEGAPEALSALLILALIAIGARWHTFGNPVIGFDEQFYLLVGDRMLHGALPYVDIFDRKPIGLFLLYAGIRLLGGDGVLQYQLVALAFCVATAFVLYRLARRDCGQAGSIAAACAYILWLDFMEAEGGQAPVFFDLFMVVAAGLTLQALRRPRQARMWGMWAMVCTGIALQIKYSVMFEGIAFGIALILGGLRAREPIMRLAMSAMLWIGAALAPTALAFAVYAATGHTRDFVFCNFVSLFGQGRNTLPIQAADFAASVAILSPIMIWLASLWWRKAGPVRGARAFYWCWLGAATAGWLIYFRFNSPHYAIPLLLPACVLIAQAMDSSRLRRAAAFATIAAGLVVGQVVLKENEIRKGGRHEAMLVAAAAEPTHGCIYVYDGYPALYMLTHSCLPSRWVFPGHLSARDEAHVAALGIDPSAEVRRIMAGRPQVVVDDYPRFIFGNAETHAIVQEVLNRDYYLAACVANGHDRERLIYRLRENGTEPAPRAWSIPQDCPPNRT